MSDQEETVEVVEVDEPQGESVESHENTSEIDWKAKSRLWESRAKAQKADADKWREYEQSQKTVEERRAEQLAEVQRELEAERTARLRLEIAADRGITGEALTLLDGSTREEIEAKADALQTLIASQTKPKAPALDPLQGRPAQASTSTADQFAEAIGGLL